MRNLSPCRFASPWHLALVFVWLASALPTFSFDPKLDPSVGQDRLHPLFQLENVYPLQDVSLKISAMAFEGNDLYVTVFTPDRQNKAPFRSGEVFRVSGLVGATDRSAIRATRLMGGLYEPTAITVLHGKIYIGEKDKISRLEDRNGDGLYTEEEKIVLIDGLSHPNFHTYTIGFEVLSRKKGDYLVGNLTTSIRVGGSRAVNTIVNPEARRGSTFLLGPVTGTETAADVKISYVAGGYRTPNGLAVGPKQEIVVVDNQGVFNPSNEFILLTKGGFYGHYLLKQKGANTAAFQPAHVDASEGGSRHQLPPTVHLPQGVVNRSPSQPVILQDLSGLHSAYNGQWLMGDVTLGRLNRVFVEEVEGVWQGAVFLHSGGHDPEGVTGFTAGPNRLIQGPDKAYYVGHIGDGGLWRFLPKKGEDPKPLHGLQRLSTRAPADIPADFNEMVAIRDIPGGLELEFLRPLTPDELDKASLALTQWTYVPTKGYGGRNFGTEKLTASSRTLSDDGKRLTLMIPGIRDNSPPYIKHQSYSNENVGWVIHVKLENTNLYQAQGWYTMIRHQGGGSQAGLAVDQASVSKDPIAYAKAQHAAICAACHTLDGSRLAGPSFKGLFGQKQDVLRNGEPVEVTVDDAYLLRAIADPMHEYPVGYPPAMPNLGLKADETQALVNWIKSLR